MGHVNLVCWHWPNLMRQFGLGEKCLEKEKEKEKCREEEHQEKHREEKEKRRQLEGEKEEKRQRFEEDRRLEKEEKDEKRRRENEEIETRRQEQELSRLEMEAEIMRQKEVAEGAKREHKLELARLGQGNVHVTERIKLRHLNAPCLLMVRTPWMHICRGLRDLQIQPSGIKLDGHQRSVFCCSVSVLLSVYSCLSEEAAKDYDENLQKHWEKHDVVVRGHAEI